MLCYNTPCSPEKTKAIRSVKSPLPVPTTGPIAFIFYLCHFLILHLLGLLIDIPNFLCIWKANLPIPRRRLRPSPSLPMPRDPLSVCVDVYLAAGGIRMAAMWTL